MLAATSGRRPRACPPGRQELISRLTGELDGLPEERFRCFFLKAAGHESLHGRLIAGGDDAVGAGLQIVEMDVPDEIGIFQ